MKLSILCVGAAVAAALVAGCNRGQSVAAVVNGDVITLDQFHKWLELKPQVQVLVDPNRLQSPPGGPVPQQAYNGVVIGSIGLQGLNDLVQQILLKQMARDAGVYPSAADVDKELADRTKQNQNYVSDRSKIGFSLDMIRDEIALQLANFKLTTQGITVTDDEVAKYIQEHPQEFVVPEAVDMSWMLVPDEKTEKMADADLKQGQAFVVVAAHYTIAQNARQMQYHFPEQLMSRISNYGPELSKAVKDTPEQGTTNWMKLPMVQGFAKFFINKKAPERKMPIDDALRKRVHDALMLQKGSQAKDLNIRIQEKLKNANIQVAIPYLKDAWEKSMQTLQASTSSSSSPTGSTAGK